jgi:hypothetical protein
MDNLERDALLTLRARLLAKGWRMTEYNWIKVNEIDKQLKERSEHESSR